MNDCIPLIAQQMRELVLRWFTVRPLAHFAELFIEEKLRESFKFGQLTVIHYKMFGGAKDEVYQAAAAVELFVLGSDMLDDLQDQDAPDKPWMQVPAATAIHIASSLITLSQQAMLHCTEDNDLRIVLVELMNTQMLAAANGQMLDIMNSIMDEPSYLEMVKQKSSPLLLLACMAGVMLSGQPWNAVVAEYAIEIGIAAQLRNDIRDLMRWDDKSDFLQRKRTLLTMYLVESLGEDDKWIREYFEGRMTHEDVVLNKGHFVEVCERTGTLLYGSVMSRIHYNRFEELLHSLQEAGPWKSDFLQILN
ncbi:polyprenyl synthetase family protein [Paenibacillus sp. sgz302251]|uniref:polyprenyl synthetase family protein n=1 Tax=Paenibacillus sp. sgz302251 TaxID=3414493 RepID=UPI003C7BB1C6